MAKFGDVPVNGLEDCFIMWKLSQLKKVKKIIPPFLCREKCRLGFAMLVIGVITLILTKVTVASVPISYALEKTLT